MTLRIPFSTTTKNVSTAKDLSTNITACNSHTTEIANKFKPRCIYWQRQFWRYLFFYV